MQDGSFDAGWALSRDSPPAHAGVAKWGATETYSHRYPGAGRGPSLNASSGTEGGRTTATPVMVATALASGVVIRGDLSCCDWGSISGWIPACAGIAEEGAEHSPARRAAIAQPESSSRLTIFSSAGRLGVSLAPLWVSRPDDAQRPQRIAYRGNYHRAARTA